MTRTRAANGSKAGNARSVEIKRAAEAAVEAVFASIAEALARGEDVTAAGFGRFARTRGARSQGA